MTDDDKEPAEFHADHTPPDSAVHQPGPEPAHINPYQSPAIQPDDAGGDGNRLRSAVFGPNFMAMAIGLLVLGLLITVITSGLGLPLLLSVVGGIIRASALIERQKSSSAHATSPEALLITSSFITFVLLFCCAIAFVTICTGGVIMTESTSAPNIQLWTVLTGLAALAAFVLMFIRSMKWGA